MKLLLTALSVGALVATPVLVKPKPQVVEKVVHVQKPQHDLPTLVKAIAPRYNIKPELLLAIAERESGGKRDAIRFEPGQMTRAAKISRNPEQQRMYASSHGVFQVMGWWTPQLGLSSWTDLYDLETNVESASRILSKCMDDHKRKPRYEQIHGALACYNGSTKYADAVLGRLGRLLIERSL